MAKNYHSISEILAYFMRLQKYATEVLSTLNESVVTENDTIILHLQDSNGTVVDYKIPSFSNLDKRIREIDRQLKSLNLMRDIDNNKDIFGKMLVKEPNLISELNSPLEFFIKPNYFFENMINPLLYITVNLTDKIHPASKHVVTHRMILDINNDEKKNFFEDHFNKRNDLDYDEVREKLLLEGIEYIVDEEYLTLPPLKLTHTGSFNVLNIHNDVLTNKDYATVRKYTLDKLTYNENQSNGEIVSKNLKHGDVLITTSGETHYNVVSVNQQDNTIQLGLEFGYDIIPLGADVLKIGTILSGEKAFQITIGPQENQIIFIKSIDPYLHTTTQEWSSGFSFASRDLFIQTNDGKRTFDMFYKEQVNDFAKLFLGLTKEQVIPSMYVVKPKVPVLNGDNFKVHILNEQVKDTKTYERKKKLVERRDLLENKKAILDSTYQDDVKTLEEDYTKTMLERLSIQQKIDETLDNKTNVVKEIRSISEDMKLEHDKIVAGGEVKVKTVIDGAWEIPEPEYHEITGDQYPTRFEIKITYLDSEGNPNKETQIPIIKMNGDVEIHKVPIHKIITTTRKKFYLAGTGSPNITISDTQLDIPPHLVDQPTGYHPEKTILNGLTDEQVYLKPSPIDLSNPIERPINSLPEGIPIDVSSGEKVQIQIRSIIDTWGLPTEEGCSEWSEPIIIISPNDLLPEFSGLSTLNKRLEYYSLKDESRVDIDLLLLENETLKARLDAVNYALERNKTSINRITLTADNITNKWLTLPKVPITEDSLVIFVDGGPKATYDVDYSVVGDRIVWAGKGFETLLVEGDQLVLVYLTLY